MLSGNVTGRNSVNNYASQGTLNSFNNKRPSTTLHNVTAKSSVKGDHIPSGKFDFVATSEACLRIKKKLNSTAFGKTSNTQSVPNLTDFN